MLIGRDADVAAVGRAVVVRGEAGIGKTALLDAAAACQRGAVHRGGALQSLSWLAYLPLSRAVRSQLHGDPAAVAVAVRSTVRDGLLVIDDLQWADPQTLAALVPASRHVRILAAVRSGDDGEAAAVAAAGAMGATVVPVGPLSDADVQELIAALAPGMTVDEARRVAAGAGGNPLLARELLRPGPAASGLRDALAARVRAVSPEARAAVALLGVLGRPVGFEVVAGALDELRSAELVAVRGGRVALRHPLHAEAALATLDDGDRAALHRRAARLVADPGEAARHHAVGGERAEAAAAALDAAARATCEGDRARHLALAAECTDAPAAGAVLVAAARAALAGGDAASAERLAAAAATSDLGLRAEAAVVQVRARVLLGDPLGAKAAAEEGLALDPPPDLSAALASELGAVLAWPLWRPADALSRALAGAAGGGARARTALAQARVVGADPGWRADAVAALAASPAAALDARDAEAVLACGAVLFGDAAAADVDGVVGAVLSLHVGGDCEASACALRPIAGTQARAGADVAAAHLALALADAGRTGEALSVVGAARSARRSPVGEALLWWAQAEAEWQAGRPRRARAAARSCTHAAPGGFPAVALAAIVDAWCALDLGEAPGAPPPGAVHPAFDAVAVELAAVAALAAGDAAGAESRFAAAAGRWRPVHRRGELRCRWAAGEAAIRAGAADRARAWLQDVERDAAGLGQRPMVARARAGLRRVGVRLAPSRSAGRAGLTGREVEVLGLVGEGLTSGEISARLGVARSTVDTQVESAVRKLGARTRVQAAALLREHSHA